MLGILKKILGDSNEKEVRKLQKTVDLVNALEASMEKLSDPELRSKTDEFKERLSRGKLWMISCQRPLRQLEKHQRER